MCSRRTRRGRRIFKKHLAAEGGLDLVDVLDHPLECFGGIWHRQQIVEEADIVRRPRQMFGEQARLVAPPEMSQPLDVVFVQRNCGDMHPAPPGVPIQPVECRRLHAAGGAPRRPEIQKDRLAAQRRQIRRAAFETEQPQRRQFLSRTEDGELVASGFEPGNVGFDRGRFAPRASGGHAGQRAQQDVRGATASWPRPDLCRRPAPSSDLLHRQRGRRLRNGRPERGEKEQRIWQPVQPSDRRFARPVRKTQVEPHVQKFVDAEPGNPVRLQPRGLQVLSRDVVVAFERRDSEEADRPLRDYLAARSMRDPDVPRHASTSRAVPVDRFAASPEKSPAVLREDGVTIPHPPSNGSGTVHPDETKGGDAMTSGNWIKGMVAGFVATVVLSTLMLMKAMMGVMPELNPIKMIANMLGVPPAVGWSMHFMIRTVLWGTLFAWLDPTIPREGHWLKGILFAVGAW